MGTRRSERVGLDREATLTRRQWVGLETRFNLADGHSRQALSAAHERVIDGLPALYRAAGADEQSRIQARFSDSFAARAGQASWAHLPAPLFHYSASVSIEVVAHFLAEHGMRVALCHPTFDNIPALLTRHSVPLVPVDDSAYRDPDAHLEHVDADAIFMVLPNNPTGRAIEREAFRRLARHCRRRDRVLVLDFSFRFFGTLCDWDQYAVLHEEGTSYIALEDTGKTWPTEDLKLGILLASGDLRPSLAAITDDVLLNVSPFVFALLTEFIEADPVPRWISISRRNAELLARTTEPFGIAVCPPDETMSVSWAALPAGVDGVELCEHLTRRGVTILPGNPFFWSTPDRGRHFVRVATLRPEDYFAAAMQRLAAGLADFPRLAAVAPQTPIMEAS
jgi:aspartate/methionine/tyrosine aminotransferase